MTGNSLAADFTQYGDVKYLKESSPKNVFSLSKPNRIVSHVYRKYIMQEIAS